jgi:hypothetical protein
VALHLHPVPSNDDALLLGCNLVEAVGDVHRTNHMGEAVEQAADDPIFVRDPHAHDLELEQAEGLATAITDLLLLARDSGAGGQPGCGSPSPDGSVSLPASSHLWVAAPLAEQGRSVSRSRRRSARTGCRPMAWLRRSAPEPVLVVVLPVSPRVSIARPLRCLLH